MSVELRAPIRRLEFLSTATYQREWLQPGALLGFRCEFSAAEPRTGRPVRALLLARLAVRRARALGVETSRYELARVKDLDFALSLDGETMYEAHGAVPMEEGRGLVFTDEAGCWTTIDRIMPGLRQAVHDENR